MTRPCATLRAPGHRLRAGMDARLLRFAAVGALTTALDFTLFTLAVARFGAPLIAANAGSYATCVMVSFVLNRRWTFERGGRRSASAAFMRFVASNLAGLALSTALVSALATLAPPVVAKAVSVPLVFLWNFAASRLWVFR